MDFKGSIVTFFFLYTGQTSLIFGSQDNELPVRCFVFHVQLCLSMFYGCFGLVRVLVCSNCVVGLFCVSLCLDPGVIRLL